MRILILGGTGLTGPHQVRYAVDRGHDVTLFNRSRTPADLPSGVKLLTGDRAAGELSALATGEWDVCIDNPTTLPVWVRDAGRLLHGRVGRYVFISTISVYADADCAEDAPLHRYEGADPHAETFDTLRASNFELYGPLKAACEQEARRWFGDALLLIRPGLIVGPGDPTDRFTYWPWRIAQGGEVLAPGTPSDPVQFIDARDLAEWTVRMAEDRATGTFNGTGPAARLGIGELLERTRQALDADASFTWVPATFLAQQGVAPWSDMPAWLPADGEGAGIMRARVDRALGHGLTFRPLEVTVRDTFAWFRSLPPERQAALRAGLSREREAAVLGAWRSSRQRHPTGASSTP
jgi:2'-hydroxyisoflavone reductase